MISEETYGRGLRRVSVAENYKMRQSLFSDGHGQGGSPDRIPQKLLDAAGALYRKGTLTATDLAHIMDMPQPNASALLFRLQRLGFATSELHEDARIRIFSFDTRALGE